MFFYIAIGKFLSFFINLLKIGRGSTWPGHLVLKINKNFIKQIIAKNSHLITVVIAGTNGKTTTTALIRYGLEKNNISVLSNQEGANLVNGLVSILLKACDLRGKIKEKVLLFEADEFSFPLVVKEINPDKVLILNLFRDQLDRYGEVNTILSRWQKSLKTLKQSAEVYLNMDDPQLYFLGKNLKNKVYFFGINPDQMLLKKIPHDVDFNFCPVCFSLLNYQQLAYGHLGIFFCLKCGFTNKNENRIQEKIFYPLKGLYNQYNINAAFLLLEKGFSITREKINLTLKYFSPAFGRQEIIKYKDRNFFILLSKNPTGFNQSIKTIVDIMKKKKGYIFLLLNDRIPDGQDVSWIWDVDFKELFLPAKKIVVSGDRAYDLAIRLKYEADSITKEDKIIVFDDDKQAVNYLVRQTKINEKIFVLPTYSAMLDLRQILLGKKLL